MTVLDNIEKAKPDLKEVLPALTQEKIHLETYESLRRINKASLSTALLKVFKLLGENLGFDCITLYFIAEERSLLSPKYF